MVYLYNEPRKERKVIVARKKQHYVDNEKFLVVMSDYREKYLQAKDDEEELPIIPDYAGECFLKIAERLSHRPNFINYAFREEMVSDGIENCVMYASNFNPEKSTNPFAYFTQIIYYAFIRSITKEKKQSAIKQKIIDNTALPTYAVMEGDDTNYENTYIEFLRENLDEREIPKTKQRKQSKKGIEHFIEENDYDQI